MIVIVTDPQGLEHRLIAMAEQDPFECGFINVPKALWPMIYASPNGNCSGYTWNRERDGIKAGCRTYQDTQR